MFTVSSNIFSCSREQARFVAECANLRHEVTSKRSEAGGPASYTGQKFDLWQDRQTGGGGCRIVWSNGVAWVSRHSGYAYADVTEEVCEFFREIDCQPARATWQDNPFIYPK